MLNRIGCRSRRVLEGDVVDAIGHVGDRECHRSARPTIDSRRGGAYQDCPGAGPETFSSKRHSDSGLAERWPDGPDFGCARGAGELPNGDGMRR